MINGVSSGLTAYIRKFVCAKGNGKFRIMIRSMAMISDHIDLDSKHLLLCVVSVFIGQDSY